MKFSTTLHLSMLPLGISAIPLWGLSVLGSVQNPLPQPPKVASSVSLIPPEAYERWLQQESEFAFDHIIDNIGGYGTIGDKVLPGQVVASPSKHEPDYYYIWTRDAALTMNSVVTRYNDGQAQNGTLQSIILDYIDSSAKIQRTDNPSGTWESGEALGEPKFQVDGSAFTDNWGRPQRDGPALRATTIINYIRTQLRHNDSAEISHFASVFATIVQPDLDYVAQHWRDSGFDLWEEIRGNHFFTSTVQLHSLVLGAKMATEIYGENSESAARYRTESVALKDMMKQYLTFSGRITETINGDGSAHSRNGLDAAIFLGAQYSLDLQEWNGDEQDDVLFAPYSNAIISTVVSFVDDMAVRYPLNRQRLQAFERAGAHLPTVGVALGRYPEDVYNGAGTSLGNPWFLCTASVAQNLYILADYLATRPSDFVLHLTEGTSGFFAKFGVFSPSLSKADNPQAFEMVTSSIVDYADSFMDVLREHHASDGRMSEQFSRYDGMMRGAEDLTWSYGAFWGAARQRSITKSHMA